MTNVVQIDGLPVIDAKRPVTLVIIEPDVSKATKKAPNACAIARACARQLHVKEARIHLGRIYLRTNDYNWVRYQTPVSLRSEIIAFDRGGKFEAGEYRIKPPPPSNRAIGKRQGGPDKNRPTTAAGRKAAKRKYRTPYHRVTDVRSGPA